MWRPNIKNRAFDRMGERYAHKIDPNHFLGRSAFDIPWPRKKGIPPVNVKREEELFIIEMPVPGFEKDEIEILLDDDILTVRGEKSQSEKGKKGQEFILEEFDFDSFERKFKLAASIAHEKITAKLQSGILRLTFIDVPKEEEKEFQTVKVE